MLKSEFTASTYSKIWKSLTSASGCAILISITLAWSVLVCYVLLWNDVSDNTTFCEMVLWVFIQSAGNKLLGKTATIMAAPFFKKYECSWIKSLVSHFLQSRLNISRQYIFIDLCSSETVRPLTMQEPQKRCVLEGIGLVVDTLLLLQPTKH